MRTSFEPTIRALRVEAFRGFRDYQEFDLDASAVIITGPNGTGKTSFFDAMQWCLVGSIERLDGLRSRRNIEHIVNQFRVPERAVVELDLVAAGRRFSVRRSGDQSGSTLEFREDGGATRFGDEATQALHDALVGDSELTLDALLSTSGLMQQDVMRSVLEAKPADRYRHLSSVLGLGHLEDFEEAARDAARDAKVRADAARVTLERSELELEQSRSRLETQERLALARPQFDAMRQGVLDSIALSSSGVQFDAASFGDLRGVDSLTATVELVSSAVEAVEQLARSRQRARLLSDGESLARSEDNLRVAAAARDEAVRAIALKREAVVDATRELNIARDAGESMARLAAAAIPLLSDNCPVCGQQIDRGHVERELLTISAETETVVSLSQTLAETREELMNAESRLSLAEQQVQEKTIGVQRARERDQAIEQVRRDEATVRSFTPAISFEDSEQLLPNGTNPVIDHLQVIQGRIRELISALEGSVTQPGIERERSEIQSLQDAVATLRDRAIAEAKRSGELKRLADAAVEARVAVTNQRFEAVQPLVSDIYRRLDPHPVFKEFEFELDTYYRRGTTTPVVRDEITGVSADPLLVFSTSQANIAALSYFLAMGWSAGSGALPFILLDDPVQSMDDVNVLGFADLSRHLRQDRQLIISTHERRFANLLERKLAPRSESESTKIIRFVAWDRGGPVAERHELSPSTESSSLRVVRRAS